MKNIDLFGKMILTAMLVLASVVLTACRSNRIEKPETFNQTLPSFLSFVAPAPQTEYSVEEYDQGQHYPQDVFAAPEDTEHRICTEFIGTPLLEPGDFFALYPDEGEFFPDRVSAYVDGEEVAKDEVITTILGEGQLQDKDGKVIAAAPGPQRICWVVPLKPGEHWAMIEVEKTSGETVRYSWTFQLTD